MNYLIVSKGGYGFFMVPRLGQAIATEKVYFWTPESKLGNMGENLNEAPGWEKLEVVADFGTVLKDAKKDNLIVIIAAGLFRKSLGVVGIAEFHCE